VTFKQSSPKYYAAPKGNRAERQDHHSDFSFRGIIRQKSLRNFGFSTIKSFQ
jgi:hypothetical protein